MKDQKKKSKKSVAPSGAKQLSDNVKPAQAGSSHEEAGKGYGISARKQNE